LKKPNKLFLLHPTRRTIYKIICENPGTYFYRLINEVSNIDKKISTATLIYHLKKLEETDLISSDKIDGKRIYFPNNLRNAQMERAYTLLKNKNALKIFLLILNNNGVYKNQNEIARALNVHHDTVRYHTNRLEEAGLIQKTKDGKLVAFEIGELGKELLNGSSKVFTQGYIRFLINKLADSCHFPEIIEQTREKLTIRIVCKDEEDIILTLDLTGWDVTSEFFVFEDDGTISESDFREELEEDPELPQDNTDSEKSDEEK
jgi:DNA-binding transcriptional ArsR family regulator